MNECRICSVPDESMIATTRLSMAFFSPVSAAAAHLVVAPRQHRLSLLDMDEAEASDLLVLCRSVAGAACRLVPLEKFYLAAIADIDKHFHLHLLPKRTEDPGLGPFIFGERGWAGVRPPESGVDGFRQAMRSRFGR